MKITIGISAYNQAEYLADAIETALEADEVIVVIDGSEDASERIAKSYPVKVVTQVNKGLASARNTAIMNMTGDYFLPLDSDDMFVLGFAEVFRSVMEATEADIIAPSMKCIGAAQEEIRIMSNPTIHDFKVGNRFPYASAIKREALLECGGYSPRMSHGYEDYHLWFDLLSRGKTVATIDHPLFLYRVKENGMWKQAVKNHHKELMEQIYKDFPSIWPK